MALVYALIDSSNPDEMRYIGRTTRTTKDRLYEHLNDAKKSAKLSNRLNFIREVFSLNNEVLAIILESGLTEDESFVREEYLIAYYRAYGDRLTNVTNGGEGVISWMERLRVAQDLPRRLAD